MFRRNVQLTERIRPGTVLKWPDGSLNFNVPQSQYKRSKYIKFLKKKFNSQKLSHEGGHAKLEVEAPYGEGKLPITIYNDTEIDQDMVKDSVVGIALLTKETANFSPKQIAYYLYPKLNKFDLTAITDTNKKWWEQVSDIRTALNESRHVVDDWTLLQEVIHYIAYLDRIEGRSPRKALVEHRRHRPSMYPIRPKYPRSRHTSWY